MLNFTERETRINGPGNILAVCWRQWRAERALARRGIHFRTTKLDDVEKAYAAMTDQEFDAINGRQDWANWRTIPRAMNGHIPDRPLTVLDLGCGTGSSTKVLAFYCPPGSRIIGYELAAPLVEIARRREFRHRSGQRARVEFCCQGITEALRDPAGKVFQEQSVNLVNASGVVGHHLTKESTADLAKELKRILCSGGLAMLDVGPTMRDAELTEIMATYGFGRLGRFRSWFFDPTGEVVFRK